MGWSRDVQNEKCLAGILAGELERHHEALWHAHIKDVFMTTLATKNPSAPSYLSSQQCVLLIWRDELIHRFEHGVRHVYPDNPDVPDECHF